jgi:hypothetical protein
VAGPQTLWFESSLFHHRLGHLLSLCRWSNHSVHTSHSSEPNEYRTVFYVVETHSVIRLSCQALQCLWLGHLCFVHTMASVGAALHSGDTLSRTRLIKYVMCCNNSPKTSVSNTTQRSNTPYLDSLISICSKMLGNIIFTALMFL